MNLIILVLFLVSSLFAQAPETLWSRAYGGPTTEICESIVSASGGGFVLAGDALSFGSGGDDFWIVKVDCCGDSVWSKTIGGSETEHCKSVIETSDLGFIMGGTSRSFSLGPNDFLLAKISSTGDSSWSRTYGNENDDQCFAVLERSVGGYILAGWSYSFSLAYWMTLVVATNSAGDSSWSRYLSFGAGCGCNDALQDFDDNIVLAGYSGTLSSPGQFWISKISAMGDSLWSRSFGGTDDDRCNAIVQTPDSGYALAGYTRSFGSGNRDFWLLKIDKHGDSLWARTFGGIGREECFDVELLPDGGLLLAGYTNSSPNNGNNDFLIIRTNSSGDSLWSQTYGGVGEEQCNSAVLTDDDGFALAGRTTSFGSGNHDMWLVKTGQDHILPVELLTFAATPGNERVALSWSTGSENNVSHFQIDRDGVELARVEATNNASGHTYTWQDEDVINGQSYLYALTSVDFDGSRIVHGTVEATPQGNALPNEYSLSQNYPNPFNATTEISFALPNASDVAVDVFDVTGRFARTIAEGKFEAGEHRVSFDASGLTSGVYFYELRAGDARIAKKMLLLK